MYEILPLNKKIQNQIKNLRQVEKQKLRMALNEIETNPYSSPTDKIEKFRGDLAYLGWHYKLSYSYRIHYRIDEENKKIKTTYIGPHPDY